MFGGGTDHPKWFNNNGGGAVVSFSIDKYCYISLRELPPFFDHNFRISYSKVECVLKIKDIQHPAVRQAFSKYLTGRSLELQHHGDLPSRSGVGSSSSFAVGLIKSIHALNGADISQFQLSKEAIELEQIDLKENVGYQDQIAVSYGGINLIEFKETDSWSVTKIELNDKYRKDLESRIVLLYSGIPRISSDISGYLIENFQLNTTLMHRTKQLALEFGELILNERSFESVPDMLNESWSIKKQVNPLAISSHLEDFYKLAISRGAQGGKILGAGGGGFFMFWVDPENRNRFIESMKPAVAVNISISDQGSTRIL